MRSSLRVLSVVLPVLLVACPSRNPGAGSGAGAGTGTGTVAVPMPPNTIVDLAIDDTKVFLDGLRAQFRDPGAGVPVPATAVEILEQWSALPEQVRRHVPETTRLRAVWFAAGDETRSVIAVKVRREANPAHPLGVEIALFDGAPEGAKWVAGRPSASAPVVALKDDVLLVADDAVALRAAIRYLTENAMRETSGEGMRVRIPGEALRTHVRASLDRRLEEASESAIAAARAEGARHAEPPSLGDPAQFVTTVRDRFRRWLAYLPDARSATVRVISGASGVSAEARVEVAPGSPLARVLGAARVGAPFGFASLPVSTALAVSTRRDGTESTWFELIAPIAGARLAPSDRATLTELASELDTMRGEASVVALGGHAEGAFVLAGFEPGATPIDAAVVKRLATVPYFAGAIGSLVGCDEVSLGAMPRGEGPLCRRTQAPFPTLQVRGGSGANAVVVAARNAANAEPHPAAEALIAARDASDGWFREPDAQRALSTLSDRTIVAIALSARGIVPSLGITGSPDLQRLAASRALPTAAAPIVFGVSREVDGSIGGRVVAPPHSLEEVWAIAFLLSALGGG